MHRGGVDQRRCLIAGEAVAWPACKRAHARDLRARLGTGRRVHERARRARGQVPQEAQLAGSRSTLWCAHCWSPLLSGLSTPRPERTGVRVKPSPDRERRRRRAAEGLTHGHKPVCWPQGVGVNRGGTAAASGGHAAPRASIASTSLRRLRSSRNPAPRGVIPPFSPANPVRSGELDVEFASDGMAPVVVPSERAVGERRRGDDA